MPHVALLGYYGFHNVGDEAVLAGTLVGLRAEDAQLEVTVVSADPQDTQAQHGVRAVRRGDVRRLDALLRTADLFLLGGGSLFQDVTSAFSVWYYAAHGAWALARGCPVGFYAQGVGPLRRSVSRRVVAALARRSVLLQVRDADSARVLHRLGIPEERVQVAADPAFLLPPPDCWAGERLWQDSGLRRRGPLLVLAPRLWPEAPSTLVEALSYVSRWWQGEGGSVGLLPMHPEEDGPLCGEIARRTGAAVARHQGSVTQVLSLLGAADLVVGVRLHALILAAVAGRPGIGVTYDPKVTSLLAELAWPGVAGQEAGDGEVLVRALRSVRGEDTLARVEAIRARARAGVTAIAAWLRGRR